MNLLATMMLTGSSLYILYLLVNYSFGMYFSARWKCNILKLSLILSFTPSAYFWNVLETSVKKHLGVWRVSGFVGDRSTQILVLDPSGYHMSFPFFINFLIFVLWFLIGTIVFFHHFSHYCRQKKMITSHMNPNIDISVSEILAKQMKLLNIRKQVKIYTYHADISPFTVGIFSPIIAVPGQIRLEQLEFIIRHELMHIKYHDSLFAFFRAMAVGFYWFNPLVYFFDYHLGHVSELACDEAVLQGTEISERKAYGKLILQLASWKDLSYKRYAVRFINNDNQLKERIISIMDVNKRKKSKFLSGLVTTVLILCCNFSVFAYQPSLSFESETSEGKELIWDSNDMMSFNYHTSQPDPKNIITYDYQFTSENGAVYNAEECDTSPYANCTHAFESGTLSIHKKKSDGGCRVSYYTAQRCINCGYIKNKVLDYTTDYVLCSH